MGLILWIKEKLHKFPKGCMTGNEFNWMIKDNCPCCVANPIESLSNYEYHRKYPANNRLKMGVVTIYLCDFHLKELKNAIGEKT